jgi:myo-inositol-1(or 4)-monophosphatase
VPGTALPETAALRAAAVQLAEGAAGTAIAGWRPVGSADDGRRVVVPHDTKSTDTDPVTAFDRAAERWMRDQLAARFPEDGIVGEEGADHPGSSGRTWHLDPIDGTVNFVYGLPAWASSVAVVDEDGPLAGAVCAPVTGETYSAARGGGAWLGTTRIGVSSTDDLARALIGTGFAYDPAMRAAQARLLPDLLPVVRDIRRIGSAAIDLCLVACGSLDGYFERGLNSWDRLAGELIVLEAGGRVSGPGGASADDRLVVASGVGIHDALCRLVDVAT